jgi:hypothetical protein
MHQNALRISNEACTTAQVSLGLDLPCVPLDHALEQQKAPMAFLSQPSFTPTAKRLAVLYFHVFDCIGRLN